MGSVSRAEADEQKARALRLLAEGQPVSVVAKAVGRSNGTVKRWRAEAAEVQVEAVHGALARSAEETIRIVEEAGPEAAQYLIDFIRGDVDEPPPDEHGRQNWQGHALRVRCAEAVLDKLVPSKQSHDLGGNASALIALVDSVGGRGSDR